MQCSTNPPVTQLPIWTGPTACLNYNLHTWAPNSLHNSPPPTSPALFVRQVPGSPNLSPLLLPPYPEMPFVTFCLLSVSRSPPRPRSEDTSPGKPVWSDGLNQLSGPFSCPRAHARPFPEALLIFIYHLPFLSSSFWLFPSFPLFFFF